MSAPSSLFRPVSVFFRDGRMSACCLTEEEASNAIARVAKERCALSIDCRRRRLSAGSYFACGNALPLCDIVDMYVNTERIFPDEKTVVRFLKKVGRNPLTRRYIHILPHFHSKADVILLVVSPAQASRLLGLQAHDGIFSADIIPAAPTCATLYRPLLIPDRIHVNFIDYFDREQQARGCFEAGELLVSMTPALYRSLCGVHATSAHGAYKPKGVPVY